MENDSSIHNHQVNISMIMDTGYYVLAKLLQKWRRVHGLELVDQT